MERSVIRGKPCEEQGSRRMTRPQAVAPCGLRARPSLPQFPNLCLQERPAPRPQLLLPDCVDIRKPGAERGLVDVIEDEAGGDESVAEAGVDVALVDTLLAH